MNTFFIEFYRKKIRIFCKQNLTFKSLQTMIETSPERMVSIILTALVLADSSTQEKSSWKQLNRPFFTYYKKDILDYLGYEDNEDNSGKIKVLDEDKLFDVFAHLKKNGVLGNCSYKTLAKKMKSVFDLHYMESTIERKLKKY